jgi:mRNA interferase HigB
MSETHKTHVISKSMFDSFVASHPGMSPVKKALRAWAKIVEKSQWSNFTDVRATFNTADHVGGLVVFDISGNKVRVIARVFYNSKPRRVYLLHVLTHKEYDDGEWKKRQ